MPLFSQCPDGTPPPCSRAAARAPATNSVAVLYFANTSRDSADAYLADGLTEEIILRLQQVPRLLVKSRYESQRVRAQRNASPAALGRAVSASYLVNGTIQRAGDRLVVRVELTRADRGIGIWSERYDRTSASVLDVIDDIARGVATGVAGQLLPTEVADLARRPSGDPVAYEHLVRGNIYLAQRSSASFARAVEQYEAAYARDPQLRIALARIAYVYALGVALGVGDLPRDTVIARAGTAVERALRVAPDLSDTWIARGFSEFMGTINGPEDHLAEAVASLGRAVQIDPRNAEAHHQYGQGLAVVGPDSAALAEYRLALALEPGRAVSWEEMGRVHIVMGRYADAKLDGDSAVAADPQFVRGRLMRARARLALGDVGGAEQDVAAGAAAARGFAQIEARVMGGLVAAGRGDTAEARRIVDALDLTLNTIYVGELLVAVGRPDEALRLIESRSSPGYRCYLLRFPLIAALRGQPRYDRLAAGCAR